MIDSLSKQEGDGLKTRKPNLSNFSIKVILNSIK